MATAAIEGEIIDLAAVRSSVARRLGMARPGAAVPRDVEGLLDVMENAADHWPHLADLIEKGLIVRAQGPGGRSTRYDLAMDGWGWQPPAKRARRTT